MVVHLTIEEYDYLINNLLKEYRQFLLKVKVVKRGQHFIDIFLDEIVADEIRELSGDEVGSHFDENYMPTILLFCIRILLYNRIFLNRLSRQIPVLNRLLQSLHVLIGGKCQVRLYVRFCR